VSCPRGIILTEGGFKAIAGDQWGIPTVGVPGVSSFTDSNFKRLTEFLNKGKIKEICIIFDSERKDDPTLPNYKEEISKRFDTEYFSYYLCKRLTTEGFDCRIGSLPETWRINGKIDLDGALASGKTTDDIKRIVSESRNHKTYFEELTRDAKNIVQRKIAQKYYRSHISRNFGKYTATRYRGKHEFEEIISNFTIKILATHETPEEVVREVILIDEYGNRSNSFSLASSPMTSPDEFSKFCIGKGNYIWRGTRDDMANIWQGEFFEDDGRHIVEPDHIGWIESEKMWLFGNVAIKEDGTELRPDKSNIFWCERKGLKPLPLSASNSRLTINEGIPYLNMSVLDSKDVLNKMVDTLGKFEAYSLMGWVSSIVFMEEIFNEFNCYPFLFITGKRGSGKSTVAEWVTHFFGLDSGGKMASDTTSVALQRYLAYYSCLPLFLDEFRNTKNITMKVAPLRNCYNRQSAGKGIKTSFGVHEAKVRGTIIIAGEETPEDNALLTRCIVINVMEKSRTTNHFNWFQANKMKLSYHFYDLLKRRHQLVDSYIKNLHAGKDYFVSKGLDDRTAINYSIVGTGFMTAFGDMPQDFLDYLTTETVRVKAQYDAENAVGIFFGSLGVSKRRAFEGSVLDR
jgi:DNA primase